MANLEKTSKETFQSWHDDPKNWKLGLIYFNKEDKRIFPPKRFPALGWTINFANPKSIIAFILLLLGSVGIIQLIIYLARKF